MGLVVILRRAGLLFNPPYAAPEHRKALGKRPEGVAHRTWATVPRDRSRVGQRGPQSRGAEEQRGIGGRAFFGSFLCTSKESYPWVGGGASQIKTRRPKGAQELSPLTPALSRKGRGGLGTAALSGQLNQTGYASQYPAANIAQY